MELLIGATFWRIYRKLVPLFPRLIVVNSSVSSRLSNELLFVGFARENRIRTVNLPNLGSQQRDSFGREFEAIFEKSNLI